MRVLTTQVVQRLLRGISDYGIVSLFHDRETGELDTALFTVYFKSPRIPRLHVTLWKHEVKPSKSSLKLHRQLFGVGDTKMLIDAIEFRPSESKRALAIVQEWEMNEGDYKIAYRRDADKEATNMPIPRSTQEKIRFLRHILETEVDEAATEEHFGRPYIPGDIISNSGPEDSRVHHKYWVRDIRDRLPTLPAGSNKKVNQLTE